jgi:hypothetical protein
MRITEVHVIPLITFRHKSAVVRPWPPFNEYITCTLCKEHASLRQLPGNPPLWCTVLMPRAAQFYYLWPCSAVSTCSVTHAMPNQYAEGQTDRTRTVVKPSAIMLFLNGAMQRLTQMLRIRKTPSSNLGREVAYPDCFLWTSSLPLQKYLRTDCYRFLPEKRTLYANYWNDLK